ncbi:YheU family protein [Thermodesulfobacteriota bacterium]
MTAVKIPVDRLNSDTLQGVIEEYVSRDGTDYGHREVDIETKIRQVKRQIKAGIAVLIYDDETQTCNVFPADDPVVRSLGTE